ncbi:MAG: nucleotidyltransferase domain-containing protein [Desulfovibrionaceae bacterium]|nr:nucleotidyltransferase domain-containing protein [Desulfovibrionaceae bacterium]
MNARYKSILEQVHSWCKAKKADLLFLTIFGSNLYGTEIPGHSDLDIKGIFLPSLEALALQEYMANLNFSTSNDYCKNADRDVDVDLWSLQYWLKKLLPAGDTGALDLLFAPTHAACTLFLDPRLEPVFLTPLRLIDTLNGKACAEYALGQAKKYGLKGTKLGALKKVIKTLEESSYDHEARLETLASSLVATVNDPKFCRLESKNDQAMLFLLEKWYPLSLKLGDFFRRMEENYKRYGERALMAEKNQGLDWKAISHGLRAIRENIELVTSGKIIFPLKSREELLQIKQGRIPWEQCENLITEGLQELERLREISALVSKPDLALIDSLILGCYGLRI